MFQNNIGVLGLTQNILNVNRQLNNQINLKSYNLKKTENNNQQFCENSTEFMNGQNNDQFQNTFMKFNQQQNEILG
jgi:uncharacterized protein YigA (DUF484 family)